MNRVGLPKLDLFVPNLVDIISDTNFVIRFYDIIISVAPTPVSHLTHKKQFPAFREHFPLFSR